MPPKSSSHKSAAGATLNSKSHFLPPQRVSTGAKDPQATEVVKSRDQGGKPDKAAYDREQESLKAKIDALQLKVNEARERVQSAKGGGPIANRRKALREELDALREDQSKSKLSKGRLLDQIKSTQDNIQRKTTELNSARGKLPFKTVADVDSKIHSLEAMVESGTMKIVDEKRALAEISTLRKQRKQVEALGPQQKVIDDEKVKIEGLRKTLDDPTNNATTERWTAIKSELDEINTQMAEHDKGKDKLYEQRNELSKQLDELYARRRESAAAFKKANDKYYEKLQEDRQRRIERQKAEKEATETSKREEINTRLREEASAPAYEREIEDCQTLIAYFEKLSGSSANIRETKDSIADATTSRGVPQLGEARQLEEDDTFKGLKALKKKGEDEEMYYSASGKKGKKGNLPKKPKDEENGIPSGKFQALQLPLSSLTALLALGVASPMTRNDIPATIQALTEKRDWFTASQDQATKDRIAETERKIAASEKQALTNGSTAGANDQDPTELPTTNTTTPKTTPMIAIDQVLNKVGEEGVAHDREASVIQGKVLNEQAQNLPM